MRPLFALTLTLPGNRVDVLTDEARRWLRSKYAGWDGALPPEDAPDHPAEGVTIATKTRTLEEGRYRLLTLEHPDRQLHGRVWRTELTLASDGATTECSLVLYTRTTEFGIAPPHTAQIHTPRLLRTIIERYDTFIGKEPISRQVLYADEHNIDDLVAILENPKRRVPVVLVSHEARTGEVLIDPMTLADRLLGHARIIVITPAGSYALSDRVGRTLSCFDGGVRVYWPGFHRTDEMYRHPLYLKQEVRRLQEEGGLEHTLFELFQQAAIARFEGGAIYRRLREVEKAARRQEVRLLREKLRSTPESEEWMREMDRLLEENERLRAERDELELDVLERDEIIARLQRELKQAHENLRNITAYREGALPEPMRRPTPTPRIYLSARARDVYQRHPGRRERFDRILATLLDPARRESNSVANKGKGGFALPRGNTDERCLYVMKGDVVYVCELFPHHQDNLAQAYNDLRIQGISVDDYDGFEPWYPPEEHVTP